MERRKASCGYATILLLVLIFIAGPVHAEQKLNGCIVAIDEAKASVKVVPWSEDKKAWDPSNAKVFTYQDRTAIHGESKATIAELQSGKAVKSYHFTGMGPNGMTGAPFEIKRLSEFLGRRTTLHWIEEKGAFVAKVIELPYLFAGESMPSYVGAEFAQVVGSDNCL